MIDLHSHTVFSDGELIPAELVRRAAALGNRGVAMTDHMDMSNLDFALPRLLKAARELSRVHDITILAGAELTHVPPALIGELTQKARGLGAQLVLVHGETIAEPVEPGTNLAAIKAGVDILAHPGLISRKEMLLAKENQVALEITSRRGHSLTNGHVAALAKEVGASCVVNTDSHSPSDLIDRAMAEKVALGAGFNTDELPGLFENAERIMTRALSMSA